MTQSPNNKDCTRFKTPQNPSQRLLYLQTHTNTWLIQCGLSLELAFQSKILRSVIESEADFICGLSQLVVPHESAGFEVTVCWDAYFLHRSAEMWRNANLSPETGTWIWNGKGSGQDFLKDWYWTLHDLETIWKELSQSVSLCLLFPCPYLVFLS